MKNCDNTDSYLSTMLSKIISSFASFRSNLNIHPIYFRTAFRSIDNENLTK